MKPQVYNLSGTLQAIVQLARTTSQALITTELATVGHNYSIN